MDVAERVEALTKALQGAGVTRGDEPLSFVLLYCNGCGTTRWVGGGPDMAGRLERAAEGWELGDIYEEADLCRDCVAGRSR